MKKRGLIWLALVLAIGANAQNPRVDSLEGMLRTSLADSARIGALIGLSREFQYVDFAKSKKLGEEALALSDQLNLDSFKAKAYSNFSKILRLSGDFSSSLNYSHQALQFGLLAKDSLSLPFLYNLIGNDFYDLGEYDDAYFHYTEAHRLGKKYDTLYMSISLHNVGRIFKELKQYDKAMAYLNMSLRLGESVGDRFARAYYLDETGDILLRKSKYDSALIVLGKALEEVRAKNETILEPHVMYKIAMAYLKRSNVEQAYVFFDSAYALHAKTVNRLGMAETDLGRGMGFRAQKKYPEALRLFLKSAETAHQLNARVLEGKCHYNLSLFWEERGDFKKSLASFKMYKALQDSLFDEKVQGKLFNDQMRFESETKDAQIAFFRNLESSRKTELAREEFIRNILVVVSALTVILLVAVYRSGQRRKEINRLLIKHQEETEARNEELQRLNEVKDKFFSIISHDLRSPINALAGLLDLMSKEAVSQQDFSQYAQELRARFHHTRTLLNNMLDWILLQMDKLNLQFSKLDLHKIVNENIEMMKSLQVKPVELYNEIPAKVFAYGDSNTVNLIFRNLISNSIKFTNSGGAIRIGVQDKNEHWQIYIKDNGVGMNEEVTKLLFDKISPYSTRGTANEKGTGLGLILCKEFVERNKGRIWVESLEGQGSTFWFTLPKG